MNESVSPSCWRVLLSSFNIRLEDVLGQYVPTEQLYWYFGTS